MLSSLVYTSAAEKPMEQKIPNTSAIIIFVDTHTDKE